MLFGPLSRLNDEVLEGGGGEDVEDGGGVSDVGLVDEDESEDEPVELPNPESSLTGLGRGHGSPARINPQSSQSHIGSLKSFRAERGCVNINSFKFKG